MLFNIKNLQKQRKRDTGYRLLVRRFVVPRGAKLAITGPSGCGKSTTLDILGLSLAPDAAEEFVFQPQETPHDIELLWQKHQFDALASLRQSHMGYVLQSGELLPFLTAGENMRLTAKLSGMPAQEAHNLASSLSRKLGIAHLFNALPDTLSVGERQRVAIGRALAAKPQVILADEPTAALDPLHAEKVMAAFLECVEQFGSALILVTHDAAWASRGGLREVPFKLVEDENGVTAILETDETLEPAC